MNDLCTQCGTALRPDGVSEWWCSFECQQAWQRKGFDAIPVPARPEWRMGTRAENERDWPAPRIVPHPDGGVTMTSQPEPTTIHAPEAELATVRAPEAEPAVHLGEIDYTAPARTSIIRRILGATRSTQ